VADHQFVVFGPGDHMVLRAADAQNGDANAFDILLLGGLPIREPIVSYGPFVMNSRGEIDQAVADYQAGRLGTIPADQVAPRSFA
jgi:quercetin 2,3-dioxygenase